MPADFLDTNVLVYVASADAAKAEQAEALIARGGVISVQVLNELANVARRKMRLSWAETRAFLEPLHALFDVRPPTTETHASALELAERFGLSIYDSLIVAGALEAECHVLWSEDLQHGMRFGSLRVANPFRRAAER